MMIKMYVFLLSLMTTKGAALAFLVWGFFLMPLLLLARYFRSLRTSFSKVNPKLLPYWQNNILLECLWVGQRKVL